MLKDGVIQKEVIEAVRKIWESNDLELDVPIIDIQHAWLVAIITELNQAAESGTMTPELFQKAVQEVIDYTKVHFKLEEDLMNEIGYSEFDNHVLMHKNFVTNFQQRFQLHMNPGPDDVAELTGKLQDWLFSHIIRQDTRYRDYMLQNRINAHELSKRLDEFTETPLKSFHKEFYVRMKREYSQEDEVKDKVAQTVTDIWNQYKLSVHIPIIDMQHMWLVKLVVELDEATKMNEKERVRQFNKTVVSAIDYVKEHFSSEELLMNHYQYPGLQGHLGQHKYFINFITRRNQENKSGDPMAASNLVADLREWLLSHIALEDKKIHGFLKDRMGEVVVLTKQLINQEKIVLRKGQVNLYRKVLANMKID